MRLFNAQETQSRLPFEQLIPAIEQAFVEGCHVPLRHNHKITNTDSEHNGILLLMPAWQNDKWLGVKTVSIFPNNSKQGLPGLHSVFILYDANTGQPVAIFDGDVITSRRTVAASALAAKWLSRPDSRRLTIVGAGRVASLLADAYRTVRPIDTVFVWNYTAEQGRKLVAKLKDSGFQATYIDDLEQAVRQADIVSCATLSTEPLVKGVWLQEGTHLDLIGGFTPEMRETDDACFINSSVFVDTEEALMKAGDILTPITNGVFQREKVVATLQMLCCGQHVGRTSDGEITVYKSVGTALEDLAAAALAYAQQ